jgi:hypothetical protein
MTGSDHFDQRGAGRLPSWQVLLACSLLAAVIWLPRAFGLDRFATPDEAAWVGRSAAFYTALKHRQFAETVQQKHPGVTITWAGTMAYLLHYPGLASEATPEIRKNWRFVEPFLREHGLEPLTVLATARACMVLGNLTALLLAFGAALRLVGLWGALAGFFLIALDPFQAGLARLLHLDGLVSSLLLAALLAFLNALYREEGRRSKTLPFSGWLVVSALVTGLAWLTKSPAFFLAPFAGLLTTVELARRRSSDEAIGSAGTSVRQGRRSPAWLHVALPVGFRLLAWFALGMGVFVLFWPAMWLDPVEVLRSVFDQALSYAAEGHSHAVFFAGRVYQGDPGAWFYPINYLWRTTPPVLVGLVLAVLAAWRRWSPFDQTLTRQTAGTLVAFTLLFGIFVSLSAKKFDRYLLPAFLPLDLLAGLGWFGGLQRVLSWSANASASRPDSPAQFSRVLLLAFISLLVLGYQAGLLVQNYPYYLTYYNPLMGGPAKAPRVMMIGWGEGLDQAARYLEALPGSNHLRVMSYYPEGCLTYFFHGEVLHQPEVWQGVQGQEMSGVDYMVIYGHQWQRGNPDPAMLAYFAGEKPVYTVVLNGLDYAQVYRLHFDEP